jgi:hypothetical protein
MSQNSPATPVVFSALGALLLCCAGCGALRAAEPGAAAPGAISLDAAALYNGFEARKVVLAKDGTRLLLDERVFKAGKDKEGRVVTDVIDLVGAPGGLANGLEAATAVGLELVAEVPEGAAVEVETRSGASFFDQSGWSEWQKSAGLAGKVEGLKGRYFQVKITLKAAAADKLPALTGLKLTPEKSVQKMALHSKVEVIESKVQNIVRSPIDFQYERPDQAKLVKFRQDNKLDEVVAGGKDDFEKLVKLMDWVGSCNNVRKEGAQHETFGGFYQWDIEKVFELREVEKDGKKVPQPTVFGHCMSYAEVMVTAATAMGYVGSRHMAKEGYSQRSHEVCDIWVPSMGKWVYFDPSLTSYYMDKETKQKLNLVEMHNVILANFVPEGKDTAWFANPGNGEVKALVKKIGGKTPIECRLGPAIYGAPMDPNYDWGTRHGYMCSGFVQMTPRNDFHSHPEAHPKKFGSYPGYAGYPFWVDAKTHPRKGVNNWYTRMRDFYWTLDQAGFRLTRTGDSEVSVELGNSMPFFKSYQLKVDGKEVAGAQNPFVWKLKAGENRLEAAPVDEFGKVGLASSVTLKLQ